MSEFTHCESCPSRGNCIVERTGHTPYCRWTASGDPAKVARVVELSNESPGLATTIRNAGGAASRVMHAALQGQSIAVDPDEQARRLAICHQCDQYIKARDKCGVCGCVARWKARLKTEHCPLPEPKWRGFL